MKLIILHKNIAQVMVQKAIAAYPNTCFGYLFGYEDEQGRRVITRVQSVTSITNNLDHTHTDVTTDAYQLESHDEATQQLQLLGIYFSSPDRAAVPAEQEIKDPEPSLSYVIVTVNKKQPGPIRSWRINTEGDWEEENNGAIAG